jgi:hypothetical protein
VGLVKYRVSLLLLDQSAPARLNSECLLDRIKCQCDRLSISLHRLLNLRDMRRTAQSGRCDGPALICQTKEFPIYTYQYIYYFRISFIRESFIITQWYCHQTSYYNSLHFFSLSLYFTRVLRMILTINRYFFATLH